MKPIKCYFTHNFVQYSNGSSEIVCCCQCGKALYELDDDNEELNLTDYS